jgi:methylase of polypeptide subunit release factors
LDVEPGEDVLDLGCGSGLLAIAAARLGARRVVATDLDPAALAATEENARRNGVADRIETRAGAWYEALGGVFDRGNGERFHVIIATPPQTPAPCHIGSKYGGGDGTRHLFAAVDGAGALLDPARGRLWLLAISLANPKALRERLERRFGRVSAVRETLRRITPEEYETLHEGLFDYLMGLRELGQAEFEELGGGAFCFRNRFIRAWDPLPP